MVDDSSISPSAIPALHLSVRVNQRASVKTGDFGQAGNLIAEPYCNTPAALHTFAPHFLFSFQPLADCRGNSVSRPTGFEQTTSTLSSLGIPLGLVQSKRHPNRRTNRLVKFSSGICRLMLALRHMVSESQPRLVGGTPPTN